MPKKFIYNAPNDFHFECRFTSKQCTAHTKTGARCRRRSLIGFEYCSTHLESVLHLKIKASTIPNSGLGLFALDKKKGPEAIIFKNYDRICEYNGDILEDEELLERYDGNTAPYALQLNRTENIDCACKRGVGSLVNHKAFSYANARLTKNNQGVAFVSAMKNIKNNCEIFVTYGTDYLFNEPGVSYRTVNTR